MSFGRDFEQQLSFCVEARATFCNLEPVLVQLIHVSVHRCVSFVRGIHAHTILSVQRVVFQTVNQLAMETSRVMRGSHSRKTAAFVRVSQPHPSHRITYCHRARREAECLNSGLINQSLPIQRLFCLPLLQACAAYSFITIPSLSSIFSRLSLYLLSGQVALANQCLSQGELLLPFRILTCDDDQLIFILFSNSWHPSSVFSPIFPLFFADIGLSSFLYLPNNFSLISYLFQKKNVRYLPLIAFHSSLFPHFPFLVTYCPPSLCPSFFPHLQRMLS